MTNPEIARTFQLLGKLMELHGDNPFKIRSYSNAYMKLRKLEAPLVDMDLEEINAIPGIGKAITEKIDELRTTGKMATLEKWLAKTPPGVVDMLSISGFGPKKVKAVWQGLGVESIGELLYAVNENRLVELKGFGAKTQAELKKKLEFVQRSSGQFHYRTLEQLAQALFSELKQQFGDQARWAATGALRRRMPTLTHIELLTDLDVEQLGTLNMLELPMLEDDVFTAVYDGVPLKIYTANASNWGSVQFERTGSPEFLEGLSIPADHQEEATVFAALGFEEIPPELRETKDWLVKSGEGEVPKLLETSDIKGVVHSHSTYSDGINSLKEMAEAAQASGYDYLLITDHSKSAFYANGLKEDRLREQWAEIDELNAKMTPFRILKGIESDILNDGSLDYDDEILAEFDLVIASVHSNLRMDKERATERLITAIKNPYTHILGHPTGRLLLSREGYPIDHLAVIEACAAHGVCIELNANPYRLDMDWSWIPVAMEKGVPISINPDAHSTGGIQDIRYGVLAARKGGLTPAMCLNTRSAADFLAWFGK